MTSQPSNESEFQLYRVLQHANLLTYYDTFISQGGDDVQQLCEAGEDEFLEIMALVGMASKPLHVRRLQKALQEWVNCPARFQVPLLPLPGSSFLPAAAARNILPHSAMVPLPMVLPAGTPQLTRPSPAPHHLTPPSTASSEKGGPVAPSPGQPGSVAHSPLASCRDSTLSPSHSQDSRENWPVSSQQQKQQQQQQTSSVQRPPDSTDTSYPTSSSPLHLSPVLHDSQINRLAESAGLLAKTLPSFEPKSNTSKKKMPKELEVVMSMPVNDSRRMDLIRRYAAIYGRFDCKRKSERPLTLHEVSVNEAAAQICCHVPALLTRRDELFPLARQVVRHSGYQYSKGHSRSQGAQCYSPREYRSSDDAGPADQKRFRMDSSELVGERLSEDQWRVRHERLERLAEELRQVRGRSDEMHCLLTQLQQSRDQTAVTSVRNQLELVEERERQLLVEQNGLIFPERHFCKSLEFEDEDSQLSIGSASSQHDVTGCDSSKDEDFTSETAEKSCYSIPKKRGEVASDETSKPPSKKLAMTPSITSSNEDELTSLREQKVIASSAGSIIAVTNPALSLSCLHVPGLSASAGLPYLAADSCLQTVKTEPQPQTETATNLSTTASSSTGSPPSNNNNSSLQSRG